MLDYLIEYFIIKRGNVEVVRMSEGKNCFFQKLNYYEETNGWEHWDVQG